LRLPQELWRRLNLLLREPSGTDVRPTFYEKPSITAYRPKYLDAGIPPLDTGSMLDPKQNITKFL
jgi:hypothetical protein